jgi:hypothetical protein
MTIQQICGASAVFFLSFCNMYSKTMKHLIEIFSKKDTCFKVGPAFHYRLAQLKKEIKTGKNKM